MAEFKTFTGLVYKEFESEIHVVKPFPIPRHWRVYRGMDFGSNNPTVCVWVALDDDDNMWIYDEHYEQAETSRSSFVTVKKPVTRKRNKAKKITTIA